MPRGQRAPESPRTVLEGVDVAHRTARRRRFDVSALHLAFMNALLRANPEFAGDSSSSSDADEESEDSSTTEHRVNLQFPLSLPDLASPIILLNASASPAATAETAPPHPPALLRTPPQRRINPRAQERPAAPLFNRMRSNGDGESASESESDAAQSPPLYSRNRRAHESSALATIQQMEEIRQDSSRVIVPGLSPFALSVFLQMLNERLVLEPAETGQEVTRYSTTIMPSVAPGTRNEMSVLVQGVEFMVVDIVLHNTMERVVELERERAEARAALRRRTEALRKQMELREQARVAVCSDVAEGPDTCQICTDQLPLADTRRICGRPGCSKFWCEPCHSNMKSDQCPFCRWAPPAPLSPA